MNALEKYIQSYFGITKEDLNTVSTLFTESKLDKEEYYLREGQYCNKLSFVKSGFIRVFSNVNNKEITQWISAEGHFITDLNSFIFKQRARWNIQALTACELYTIDAENYKLLNTRIPNWQEMEKRFISSCFVDLETRVFNHLSLSAEERYQKLFEQNKALFNQVPLHYIASMLGMSPETFSRIRNKTIS